MSTPYHAKYFAHELTRIGGSGMERLSRSLFDACVDLNPHQIEAALFAFRSPVSKGVLLADEVGLGKTIEAGLVLCEYWAERRRRLLIICPASIRKQWALELSEKFNLPSVILDSKTYRAAQAAGAANPFEADRVVIMSMHFASSHAQDIRPVQWDLVVIDEAHKLRNAYRESNRMGQNIRWALEDRRKALLTATPLQNSLLELYGLSTLVDGHLFGNLPSFREQYVRKGGNLRELRERLQGFSRRTLCRQVLEYIKYTERHAITRPFRPTDDEHSLYEAISAFLQREDTYALPRQQRHLTTLIVRKLLASSPGAVAATLETMRDRLVAMREGRRVGEDLAAELIDKEEIEEEILEELREETGPEPVDAQDEAGPLEGDSLERPAAKFVSALPAPVPAPGLPPGLEEPAEESAPEPGRLDAEIEELTRYAQWARSIGVDTKARALVTALQVGFERMAEMGAAQKAVVFTESRRTQQYLKSFLEANGYSGRILTFNGANSEPEARAIYQRWVEANRESGRATGSRVVDIRTALIEHFRDEAQIMIATEAAAEGINLQFCSLVVNYDLPWNPQRIEQRIGRCHRYGQRHDVVVINFLNQRNAADLRVYEILEEKFNLFNGVFGASDEVLGSIESGVDFERRILDIYQECRSPEEIEAAFAALRAELDERIQNRMAEARQQLLEHFDEDVHARLRVNLNGAREQLDRVGRLFWRLTKFMLDGKVAFDDACLTFELRRSPCQGAERGRYHLVSKERENVAGAFLYRLSHPLGEHVLSEAKALATPPGRVIFDITNRPTRIAVVEALKGRTGWLSLQRLVIDSFEREEYLLFSGFDESGELLDQETCEKLFACDAQSSVMDDIPADIRVRLDGYAERYVQATISRSLEENNRHFQEAREGLEKWADDMVVAVEKELKDTKERIKALTRQARLAVTPEEQHKLQQQISELEKKKRRQRQRIFEVEDQIAEKRDELIKRLERRMQQQTTVEPLFTVKWAVV